MSHAKHRLIYFTDNQSVAKETYADLRGKGYQIEQHGIIEHDASSMLSQIDLGKIESPVLLLITDNFLKSVTCMDGALPKVKKWADSGWLMPIVAPGNSQSADGSTVEVPTSFERVSNIIPYMNYWQDRYQELRKKKREEGSGTELDEQIAMTKTISSDIGELLRFLRNLEHHTLDEFKANDYVVFRMAIGEEVASPATENEADTGISEQNLIEMIEGNSEELMAENPLSKKAPEAEEEVPEEILANIPGINLLENAAPEAADPADDPELDAEASSLMDELMAQQPAAEPPTLDDEDAAENNPEGLLVESDDEELNSILDEVLAEEGLGEEEEEDFEFLPEDSDDPNQFNLDALLEDEEEPETATSGSRAESEDIEIGENEMALELLPEEEDEMVEISDGKKISPEEILEHALDLFAEGETKDGLAHLGAAVENNPKNTTLRYYFAYSLARYAKDADTAKTHLETLLQQDSRHPEAWYLMGELAENQSDFDGARKCFEKAVEINPDYPDIHYRMGLLTIQYFPKETQKAMDYLEEAIRLDDENADAEYALANLLNEQMAKPKEAVAHFEKVIDLEPEHPYAYYDLALLHHQLGNEKEAAKYYQKAATIDPNLKTAENDLAFGMSDESQTVEFDMEEESTDEILETAEETNVVKEPEAASEPVMNNGKIVLITGGTAGIGRATAEVFAREGYRVIITGRRAERLTEIKEDFLKRYSTDIQTLSFDVRDAKAVLSALSDLPDEWRNVDILINNAGLSRGLAPIHEGEMEDWDTMIDTNVKGLLYLTRAIAPQMVARRSGHIINVASSAGKEVYPGGNVYCATKSAVEALTKSMRLDLFKHNVRVSQVAPGHVEETEFARVRFDWDEEKAEKTYENFQPLKSSDVAEVIYFMATRPAHVNIQDVFMFGTQQAGSNFIDRSGR